ncbi:MAG: TonB-dependent receptor [Candidatus Tectimicrobiota bacterium]|nr:MAG: TonB-dependent receptor [Candidatus Tectomicrobia bacterium]
MRILAACALAAGLALTAGLAAAQPPVALPPVEVRAPRLEAAQLARQTSVFATVIDTEDATARVESVADLLAESVGVQVRRFGGLGAFSTVSIRGSTPSQVEVYLDGVLLNRAHAGLVDLGDLPLDNLARIEVYRGFTPLHLGAGSIGGAIHLVTRPVAGQAVTGLSGSYGSFATRRFTLYRSQSLARLGYLLLFNYTESANDFEFRSDNGTPFNPDDDFVTPRINNDFRAFTVHAKGEAVLAGWLLTLANDFFTKDQGVPGQASIQSETARLDLWRDVVTLRLEKAGVPWPLADLALQVALLWQREDFRDPEGTIGVGVQDDVNTTYAVSASGQLTLRLAPWSRVGVLLEGRYETFRTVDRLPRQRGEPAREGPLQQRVQLLAALQNELQFFHQRLSLRPLLRYQFVASDFGAQPAFGTLPLATGRRDQEHLVSPSLGVKLRLTSFLDLKGNLGHFTRVPTLLELFGDRGTTLGNPELVAERSFNWDVGFVLERQRLGFLRRLFLEYAYFASDAEDLIVFVQNSQTTAQARNIGAAEIRGHEVSWSVHLGELLRLYGNYTFQEARDTSNTFSRGNPLPGRPRHELHQGLALGTRLGEVAYELDYLGKNRLDRAGAFVVGARLLHAVRLTVLPLGRRLKLTFEAKNLTDEQVEDFRGFPLPGRAFFVTAEGRL